MSRTKSVGQDQIPQKVAFDKGLITEYSIKI